MYRLWEPAIKPLFDLLRPQVVVEIGSDLGFNTRNLIEYCRRTGSQLHVIDPLPQYDVEEWADLHDGGLFFHLAPSLDVLDSIDDPDVVLIDGDHNWYTVFNELQILEKKAAGDPKRFPFVLLHDVGWPYGRRDLYYEPSRIPEAYRHPHREAGMRPGHSGLIPDGGLNAHMLNAEHEGGPRNGVLTAVEDFVAESALDLEMSTVPAVHGLGVVFAEALRIRAPAAVEFIDELVRTPFLRPVLELVEDLRIELEIDGVEARSTAEEQLERVESLLFERDQLVTERNQLVARAEELRDDLARANDSAAELGEQLAERQRELAEKSGSLHELRDKYQRLVRDHRRLRSRRSVRLATSVARVFRPIFRWWRARKGRSRAQPDKLSRSKPGDSVARPVAASGGGVESTRVLLDMPLGSNEHISREPAEVTVIVPIFNAYEELRRCLASLVRNTTYPSQLLLIDDASTDQRISPLLSDFAAEHRNVRVLKNDSNLGFVATVNRGFSETEGDVVILNSDVEVVPGWLRRLVITARHRPSAATVTALSNNAGAFSAPVLGKANEIPPGITRDELGRLIAQRSSRINPEAPTGNGFCMFIRRQALNDVGFFDVDAFPRGYGEENDFCMRASKLGWKHVIDDSTYIFHESSASFGPEKSSLSETGGKLLDLRYPEYTALVRDFIGAPDFASAREEIGEVFAGTSPGTRPYPRVLAAIHQAAGGAPASSRDLMRALSHRFEPFQLVSDTKRLVLEGLHNGELEELRQWDLASQVLPTEFSRPDYRGVVAEILADQDIDVVHIQHLIAHTFDLPSVATVAGIPVVLSFHDFFYICPTVHLLDENRRFCGGTCTQGQGHCLVPTSWSLHKVPHLKHSWVYRWQDAVREMFEHIDAFVAPSPSTAELYSSVYPEITGRLHLIEHGRDLPPIERVIPPTPTKRKPVRVLVPGNIGRHKGAEFIRALKALDRDQRLEFHFAGLLGMKYDDLGLHHGEYERDEFFKIVEKVRPSLVGLFSITAETFSHTLTEAWHAGLPVVATNLGAFKNRISRSGGGLLVDHASPETAYQQIRRIIDDPAAFEELLASVPKRASRSADHMAHDYDALYKSTIHTTRPLRSRRRPDKVLRLGLFVAHEGTGHPPSAHVRILRRYFHPSIEHAVAPVPVDPYEYLEGRAVDLDLAIVQRTALPREITEDFVSKAEDTNVPVILDLDDDLIGMSAVHPDFDTLGEWRDALRHLARHASAITVSTEPLKERLEEASEDVFVVPNQLDGHLWLAGPQGTTPNREAGETLNLVYFGGPNSEDELGIMEKVLQEAGDWLSLTVVGGAPSGSIGWCNHVTVPPASREYPQFARWLRSLGRSFDAVVLPLVDSPSNREKSDLKYLEAAAMGLPVLCSDVQAYSSVVDQQTGILVGPDVSDWVDALLALRGEPEKGAVIAQSGRRYVSQERLLEHHAGRLMDLLQTVLARAVA